VPGLFRRVDSRVEIPLSLQLYCVHDTWTYPCTPEVPVLLVSPETIDELCPPERRTGVDPRHADRLRELMDAMAKKVIEREWRERERAWRRELERFWEDVKKYEEPYAVWGLFLESCEPLGVRGPAILLCPERIRAAAEEAEVLETEAAFKRLLRATLVHEQTHAYTWRESRGAAYKAYRDASFRVLEEFIAQYTAWAHLDKGGRVLLARCSTRQPLEYRTWRFMTIIGYPHRLTSFTIAYLWSNALRGTPPSTRLEELLIRYLSHAPRWHVLDQLLLGMGRLDLRHAVREVAYALLKAVL